MLRKCLAIVLVLINLSAFSWEFRFEKEGIKVYTRDEAGSTFDAFRGEAILNARVDEIVGIILDVENYPDWCYKTETVQLISREDQSVYYRYVSDVPPVVKKREAYFFSERIQKGDTTIITLDKFESNKKVPPGYIRMPFSTGYWKLIPLADQATQVIFFTHADPGGIIPGWLANMAAVEAPYVTIKNLRALLN